MVKVKGVRKSKGREEIVTYQSQFTQVILGEIKDKIAIATTAVIHFSYDTLGVTFSGEFKDFLLYCFNGVHGFHQPVSNGNSTRRKY